VNSTTARLSRWRRYVLGFVLGIVVPALWASSCGDSSTPSTPPSSSSPSAPVASFAYSPGSPGVSQSVQFTDSSTGTPTSWAWSFGDGGTSTAQNPTHTFATAGTYTVSLTVSNAMGSNSKSVSVAVGSSSGGGSTRTIGLMVNAAGVSDGYVLFAPKQHTSTYLIDNEGRIINQWTASKYPPGQSVYLLENGHLLRACMTKGSLSSGGGEGGRIEEYDWNDNLVWSLDWSTTSYMQHHDIRMLPNGNILMLVVEKKTYVEAVAAGFNPSKLSSDVQSKGMLPDAVVEIRPTRPSGGTVVWEWHVWDHLTQDYDASKANYGVVAAHPELIDTAGDGKLLPAFWNHMNSIDYNPDLDQIAVSVRGNSEAWIIDHGTTTAEAKGHSGGRRGKGGDLLFRWGNPLTYRAGTAADQRYFQQHDVEWVRPGYPGAGNLTCFNNGVSRNYSTVDEITPDGDGNGNYPVSPGLPFGPRDFTWSYRGNDANPMYSENISGAQRQLNGNTLICSGGTGQLLEVTSSGDIVWKYICPVDASGPMKQGTTPPTDPARSGETMNSVFRIYRYLPSCPAFAGRTLTPGDFVEKY
jgi:PKD repeat protein